MVAFPLNDNVWLFVLETVKFWSDTDTSERLPVIPVGLIVAPLVLSPTLVE